MSPTRKRMVSTLAAALAVASLVPGASVAGQDLRSPDTRDAAKASATTQSQDLRSPDTRDAAVAPQARRYQDLRSPDARDAGKLRPIVSLSPNPTGDSAGVDWRDVGFVGGVLMLMGLAGMALFARRRGSVRQGRGHAVSS